MDRYLSVANDGRVVAVVDLVDDRAAQAWFARTMADGGRVLAVDAAPGAPIGVGEYVDVDEDGDARRVA